MMLLAAVILLIAFMSLTVMVGRVASVASETSRASEGGFLREVQIVDAVVGSGDFADLARFEAQRGYLLTCTADAADPFDDPGDVVALTDGLSRWTRIMAATDIC